MTPEEKTIARIIFKYKICSSKGQAFEDLFTSIMNYAYSDFRQIKPWGNIGDRKNDGYRHTEGIYYQVYAPEDIQNSYPNMVVKLKTDLSQLMNQWPGVKEFNFVINDNYKGVNADSEMFFREIKNFYNLNNASFLTAKDLENILFKLEDDQITAIIGFIPDPIEMKSLDYSILREVIGHIMRLPLAEIDKYGLTLPDWNEKIKLNGLSLPISQRLQNGYMQIHSLDEYLKNEGDFLADTLRDRMNGIYILEKQNYTGDNLFVAILNNVSPKKESMYQNAVIVIMSKYFETCDIFEKPNRRTSNDYTDQAH